MESVQIPSSWASSRRNTSHRKSLSQPLRRNPSQREDLSSLDQLMLDSKTNSRATLSNLPEFGDRKLKSEKSNTRLYNELHKSLQKEVKYENLAVDEIACSCTVCLSCPRKKEIPEPVAHAEYFASFDHSQADLDTDKDFSWIMRRLYMLRVTRKTIRLAVPDTAIVSEGEIKFIVTANNVIS